MVFECKRIHVSSRLTPHYSTVIAEIRKLDPKEVRVYLSNKEVLNHIRGYIFSLAFQQITGYNLPKYEELVDFDKSEDCILYIDIPFPKEDDPKGYDGMEMYLVKYW